MPAQPKAEAYYVTAPLVWPLLLGLRVLGLDVEALLDSVGLPRKMLLDPETHIAPDRALRLVERAIAITGDSDLGIHLAQLYEPGAFGTLDYLAHSARSLREAIELLCRYERIHQNGMVTTLEVDRERAAIRHRMVHPYLVPRQVSENTLANLVVIGRKLTGLDFVPSEVWLAHATPRTTVEQERFFACPIRWNAPEDVLFIAAELLDAPLLKASAGLAAVLDGHAKDLLGKLTGRAQLSERVRRQILEHLPNGTANLERIAQELQLTGRTLQRRLRVEGTHFAELLDELRNQLAREYLESQRFGMEDVALMLGFSDTRAFRRSFRRWTGMSPIEYRKSTGLQSAP